MNRPRETSYRDELLADGSVHRGYADGREEWRHRDGRLVRWHDNRGDAGTDELLGGRIIKRLAADGSVTYGRDIGYGRTVWGRGGTVLVNRTSFGGRTGAVLGGLGMATVALTAAQLPPARLTAEEEEELRRQQAARKPSSAGGDAGDSGGDGGGGDGGGDDWGSGDGGWSDGDFG
ncbi:hypothetical protein ACIOEX_00920 [Streptomyces sp. NPDC087850]|uniref:hypothetical protein n=1 Tax=Streptomyces sp. NPDC087850 TaxID=3365809 RepID=UPI0037F4AAC9